MAQYRPGDLYPELKHARMSQVTIFVNEMRPLYDYQSQRDGDLNMTTRSVPGVRLELPREDFDRMMNIYQTHYHTANQNPAVQDAWEKYQMLIALTLRDINETRSK